ncbi:hypothetical protein CODIS_34360 [Candidatus Thiodiazotropha endolucinida]|uniref:Uncharacterized protein n=1 Tax=Candidatus Thiodiazotropha endolucinida TaxID=1655433 RepID=A0A7Z0VJF1_9GAMM|nr:hypothetical protein CODIS_34360 [Candidatus Thiodiazotropha endolucinida]
MDRLEINLLTPHPGMQAEPGFFRDLGKPIIVFPGREGLQREHFTSLLRPDGDTVADRTAQFLLHRIFVALFQVQVTVFFIPLQDAFTLQKSGHTVADRMHQRHQSLLVGRVGTMKPCFTVFCFGVDTVKEEHVEMHVQIERTAESLDQCHRTGLCSFSSKSRLLNKMGRYGPVNDPQHPPNQLRTAGEQKPQLKWEAQHPRTGLFW